MEASLHQNILHFQVWGNALKVHGGDLKPALQRIHLTTCSWSRKNNIIFFVHLALHLNKKSWKWNNFALNLSKRMVSNAKYYVKFYFWLCLKHIFTTLAIELKKSVIHWAVIKTKKIRPVIIFVKFLKRCVSSSSVAFIRDLAMYYIKLGCLERKLIFFNKSSWLAIDF